MNNTNKILGISIAVAVLVAAVGHYYASHHLPSRNDVFAAYILGAISGYFTYLKLKIDYILKHGVASMHEQVDMSSFNETETEKLYRKNRGSFPEPAIYEHDFYNNRIKKGINFFLYVAMLAGAAYFALQKRFVIAAMIAVPFIFMVRSALKDFLDKEAQIRIAERGIWVKGVGFKPWDAIRKIVIKKKKSGKNETTSLEIFFHGNELDYADSITAIDEIKKWKQIGLILSGMNRTEVNNET